MGKALVAAAPGGSLIEWESLKGKLFVIEPLAVEKDVKTVHGTSDAIRANVYVLKGRKNGVFQTEDFEDTLIFPKVIQSQLRRQIGSVVAGRLDQGEAKRGQNAPWILAEPNAKDMKTASEFLAEHALGSTPESDDSDEGFDEPDDDDAF